MGEGEDGGVIFNLKLTFSQIFFLDLSQKEEKI
jgi:hypothetical protein